MASILRFLTSFLLALSPFLSLATIFSVSSTADTGPGSLRTHINQAQPEDTIQFTVNGTIFLDSTIWLTKNLHIQGPGPDMLIIDGQQTSRLFRITRWDSLEISGITFRNGNAVVDTSKRNGGGAFLNEGFLKIENCIFHDNVAKNGGAIEVSGFNAEAELIIERVTFYNNSAIEIVDSIFSTAFSGGAVYMNGGGGGISKTQATNCTFSGNSAFESGGAIYLIGDISGGTELFTNNCTITNNSAPGCGGIRNEIYANIVLRNTIVADNLGGGNTPDIRGFINSAGYNLIGKVGSAMFTPDSTDIIGESALLAPLVDNGGDLPTHALSCLSLAIDAVQQNSPSTDQRGQIRIGPADIGAYEWTGSDEILITHEQELGKGSLKQAILLACDGDTLDMRAVEGTIELTSTIEIKKSLTIWGNPTNPLQISGGDSVRLIDIYPNNRLVMDWLTLKDGAPDLYGGGAIRNKGHLILSHSTLRSNKAAAGGAIASYGDGDSASLTLINTTLSGNKATIVDGGAIDIRMISHPSTASLINCTVSNNRAINKGGGIFNDAGGELEMKNTILGGNYCPLGTDLFGLASSLGNNLLGDDQDATFNSTNSDLINIDSKLAYLANYGGPTFTHRLLNGSPAIDAGSNDLTFDIDQRGEARVVNNTADIGAYEYDPTTSLQDQFAAPKTRLYPNPNNGSFTLQFSEPIIPISYQVINITGQAVFQKNLSSTLSEKIAIKLPNLSTGIYMILIQTNDQIIQEKFILSQ